MLDVKRALAAALLLALTGAAAALAARPAPPLAGRDPVTGKLVSLAQFTGRAVAVNAWASWCEGCKHEAGALRAFAAAHRDVQLLGLDVQDSKAGAQAFYRTYRLSWPSIFDPKGLLGTKLGLVGVPTTFFLDRQHRIVVAIAGAVTRARLETAYRLIHR
jgi:cytochrome c biogenesis protein CcmG/thiol:disulfide interchange protein DsbE